MSRSTTGRDQRNLETTAGKMFYAASIKFAQDLRLESKVVFMP
jgi:hypothetical protein